MDSPRPVLLGIEDFLRFVAMGVEASLNDDGETIRGIADFIYQEGELEFRERCAFEIDGSSQLTPEDGSWLARVEAERRGVYNLIEEFLIDRSVKSANSEVN